MAKPTILAVMAFLLLVSLLLLWTPLAFPQSSGSQPVGKVSDTTASSDAAAGDKYLLGVGKADITG